MMETVRGYTEQAAKHAVAFTHYLRNRYLAGSDQPPDDGMACMRPRYSRPSRFSDALPRWAECFLYG